MKDKFLKLFKTIKNKPFIFQPITSIGLFFIGDYICQKLMHRKLQSVVKKEIDFKLDKHRSFRQVSFAFLVSPYVIYNSIYLVPKYIPINAKFKYLKVILWDLTFLVFPLQFSYFTYNSLLMKGYIDKQYVLKSQKNALKLYFTFRCPINLLIFRFAKVENRYLIGILFSSIWQIINSFLANDFEAPIESLNENSTIMEYIFYFTNFLFKKINF